MHSPLELASVVSIPSHDAVPAIGHLCWVSLFLGSLWASNASSITMYGARRLLGISIYPLTVHGLWSLPIYMGLYRVSVAFLETIHYEQSRSSFNRGFASEIWSKLGQSVRLDLRQ